ncbi:hypothetical protein AB0C34_17670 [Nocardia sp. NPDC049220]|uniref:hypothetical protein n=1 Tax=Nocardia sp. NPDC049220 TaxID=3155273 RepID=UPI0033D68534
MDTASVNNHPRDGNRKFHDGDIVIDAHHPESTGLVCGDPRMRGGILGVWVEWDESEFAADFEAAPYLRLGEVISTEEQRHAATELQRSLRNAERDRRVLEITQVLTDVQAVVGPVLIRTRDALKAMGRVAPYVPGRMWEIYEPVDGIEIKRDGDRTQLVVAGYIVGQVTRSPGLGSWCAACRMCGELNLYDTWETKGLNGVQLHLINSHATDIPTSWSRRPANMPTWVRAVETDDGLSAAAAAQPARTQTMITERAAPTTPPPASEPAADAAPTTGIGP